MRMLSKHFLRTCLLTGSVLLSSCAYMQSHKNIEAAYQQHTGYTLSPDFELYRAGDTYYLGVTVNQLRKHFPIIHDSIFLKDKNEPELEIISTTAEKRYRPISRGTALVLQQNKGYADLTVLSDELKNTNSPWISELPPQARLCHTKAEIAGSGTTWIEDEGTHDTPAIIQVTSLLDQVFIDWPGTILYNAAIPVMAPFVFFYEFLNDN